MTGDARTEAERIVEKAMMNDVNAHAAKVKADGGDYLDDERWQRLRDEAEESQAALVAALAAAIEVVQDETLTIVREADDGRGFIKSPSDQQLRALRDALSALRARAGEETG